MIFGINTIHLYLIGFSFIALLSIAINTQTSMRITFLSLEEDTRLSLSSTFAPLALVNKLRQLYLKIASSLSQIPITSRNCTRSSTAATY